MKEECCRYMTCLGDAISICEHCDTPFCSDHGSVGGDRDGDDTHPPHAVPSQCWKCGGFNADE